MGRGEAVGLEGGRVGLYKGKEWGKSAEVWFVGAFGTIRSQTGEYHKRVEFTCV